MSDQAEKLRQLVLNRRALRGEMTASAAAAATSDTERPAATPSPRRKPSLLITTSHSELDKSKTAIKPAVELSLQIVR
jgi:hypothetical protein